MGIHLTPTERRIIARLSDGNYHSVEDMVGCLPDPMSGKKSLSVIVSHLRKKLRTLGEDIVCVYRLPNFYYQHVRLISRPDR